VRVVPEYGATRVRFSTVDQPVETLTADDFRVRVLRVCLETFNSEEIECIHWLPSLDFDHLLISFVEMLQKCGDYHAGVDYAQVFHDLVDAVEKAISLRLRGGPISGSLIELPNDQWAITDLGLENVSMLYQIQRTRLWESDWISHMSERVGVDINKFRWAPQEAQGIHEALNPETTPDVS